MSLEKLEERRDPKGKAGAPIDPDLAVGALSPGAAENGDRPDAPGDAVGRGGRIDIDGKLDRVQEASEESFPASDPYLNTRFVRRLSPRACALRAPALPTGRVRGRPLTAGSLGGTPTSGTGPGARPITRDGGHAWLLPC